MPKKKLKEMNVFLKCIKFSKAVNIKIYADLVRLINEDGVEKAVWTDAFVKALEENDSIYIPKGKYFIDKTVVIPSNRKIVAHRKAVVSLTQGVKCSMFRNADVIDGSCRQISDEEPCSENIFIEGGFWTTQYNGRGEYGKVGAYDDYDSIHGVHALMLFSGVKNLWIKNAKFNKTASFAVQLGRVRNFVVSNIEFVECYADGVHINGDIKNGVVYDVKGQVEDDLVALNAYDWANSTINNGPIENVTVSKLNCSGGHCHCMRILPGITAEDKGNLNCCIKNIHLSNIKGVQTFRMYLQTPPYVDYSDGAKVGTMENITFENLEIIKDRTSDFSSNYLEKDLVTGNFGVFEFGSNIDKLVLKNIKIKLPVDEYPDTSHAIVIGPKSYYVKEENLEVFDPYTVSSCKLIEYKNIVINGQKVDDLRSYIKEVVFDDLYPAKMPFGYGKVEKIVKI